MKLGKEVKVNIRKPVGMVVCVRMPRDLGIRIDEFARRHDLTLSEVLRAGAERVVSGDHQNSWTVKYEPGVRLVLS